MADWISAVFWWLSSFLTDFFAVNINHALISRLISEFCSSSCLSSFCPLILVKQLVGSNGAVWSQTTISDMKAALCLICRLWAPLSLLFALIKSQQLRPNTRSSSGTEDGPTVLFAAGWNQTEPRQTWSGEESSTSKKVTVESRFSRSGEEKTVPDSQIPNKQKIHSIQTKIHKYPDYNCVKLILQHTVFWRLTSFTSTWALVHSQ